MFTGCEVYNLGTGKGTSVLEMVRAFEAASGKVIESCLFFWSFISHVPFFSLLWEGTL